MTYKFGLYTDDGKLIVEFGTDRHDDYMQSDIKKLVECFGTWSIEVSPEKYVRSCV